MFDHLLSLVAPHSCLGCGAESSLLCPACACAMPMAVSRCYRCHKLSDNWRTCAACRRHSKLFCLTACTRYEATAEALVRKLKYGQATAAAAEIAERLVTLLPEADNLLITHLPTASSRVRSRGFDQAKLIACSLAGQAGVPYAGLLARIGQERQVGAGRAERYTHASEMFRARNRRLVIGASVVVVDDVVTTGASLEAAAAALRARGARRIYGLVFCQA